LSYQQRRNRGTMEIMRPTHICRMRIRSTRKTEIRLILTEKHIATREPQMKKYPEGNLTAIANVGDL